MSSYNQKCDIWSLGVILFLILSGKPPFNGPNDQAILKKVYEGKYSMDGDEWKEVSASAKDLISKMLCYDIDKRPSAKECLDHPWIKETGKVDNQKSNIQIGRRSLRNLKSFRSEANLQEALLYFIVTQLTSKEEKEDLTNTFISLDTDNDGKLSRDDLIKAYVAQGEDPETVVKMVDEIIVNVDKNDKGYIDYTEFLTISQSKLRLFTEERLMAAFKLFDEKDQGYLTVDDLKSILHKGDFAKIDESIWSEMLTEVAGDEGRITFEKFKNMLILFTKNEQITQSLAHA